MGCDMIQVNQDAREIIVYDIIGPSWGGMAGADEFVEALAVFKGQDISVRINSPGGSADEGLAMYHALKRHSGTVTTWNDSVAASAASVLFLGGSVRMAAKQSRVLIHEANTMAMGGKAEFLKGAEVLDKYNQDIVEIYSEATGIDAKEVASLMADETWYRAQESVDAGFATAIFEPDKEVEAHIVPVSWYKKTPEAYLKPATQLQFIKQRPQITPDMQARAAKFQLLTGKSLPL